MRSCLPTASPTASYARQAGRKAPSKGGASRRPRGSLDAASPYARFAPSGLGHYANAVRVGSCHSSQLRCCSSLNQLIDAYSPRLIAFELNDSGIERTWSRALHSEGNRSQHGVADHTDGPKVGLMSLVAALPVSD